MLNMAISRIAYQIVTDILLGNGRENEALYLNFDLRLSYHKDERSYDQARGLHLLYHVLPGMRYVNVFSGVTKSPFGRIDQVDNWKHECSHDSCWRDIQVFSGIYFEMAEWVNTSLIRVGKERVAPAAMHEWNSFRDKLFQWIPVKVTKDPKDENNYRKLVELT